MSKPEDPWPETQSRTSGFRPFDPPARSDENATTDDPPASSEPVNGLLPAWDDIEHDDYADFDHESQRIAELFEDPYFEKINALREEIRPARSMTPNGSVGRAVALGFANVFDPDRVREDIMVVAERGEGDPDVPDTIIDPDDPRATKVIFKRKKNRSTG